jgi:hypothetical protein
MANSYLNRTPSSTGNRRKFTISAWLKRSKLGSTQIFANAFYANSDSGFTSLRFNGNDKLEFTGWSTAWFISSQLFRDTSAWYHIVVAVDTENSTAGDRIRAYVNGSEITAFDTENNPSVNQDLAFNVASYINDVGANRYQGSSGVNTYDGYISHFALVDGQQLAPTVFGQTDSTSGIWKFKPPSGVTWGTNGFHLKFENSGNLGLDSSGNTNNFTVNGNLKQALDTPSNVSATLTPLAKSNGTLTNGNTTWAPSGNNASVWSSIAVNSGKWYFEMKKTSGDAALSFSNTPKFNGFDSGSDANSMTAYMYYSSGGASNNRFRYNGTNTAFPSGFGDDDVGTIYGVTMDFTNDEIIIRRNNDDSTKATFSIPAALKAEPIHVGYSVSSTWPAGSFDFNFGNGFFGTTAITSAGSNGNGSLFEYDVPSGFYALNTKNINTYG